MGYEIYYDKRFVKIGEEICPIVQHGSNNCWQCSYPRDIPEKNWSVMNYSANNKILFKPEELKELYAGREYEDNPHKSRNKRHEDFSKWLIAGIKSALTLKEHRELGNKLEITGYEEVEGEEKFKNQTFEFNTDEEFFLLYEMFQNKGFKNINVRFTQRDIYKPRRSRKKKEPVLWTELDEYFVIKNDISNTQYLCKLTKYGYRYITSLKRWNISDVKKFEKQKDAQKYLEKYWDRLPKFHVHKIENEKENKSEGV